MDIDIKTFRPLFNRVLVRRLKEGIADTVGSIIIPDSAKTKSFLGEVLAVGPGKRVKGIYVPMGVEVGEHVLFGRYSGSDIPDRISQDGEEYVVLHDDEILAVDDARLAKKKVHKH